MYCSDSSEVGFGVCQRQLSEQIVRSWGEVWGKRRYLNSVSAAARRHALGDDYTQGKAGDNTCSTTVDSGGATFYDSIQQVHREDGVDIFLGGGTVTPPSALVETIRSGSHGDAALPGTGRVFSFPKSPQQNFSSNNGTRFTAESGNTNKVY